MNTRQLDDVETEIGFNNARNFTFLELIGSILKRLDHHAAPEKAKIAALGGRAWIIRVLFGQISKRCRVFLDFLEHFLGLGFGLLLAEFFGGNQDVAGTTLFRHLVITLVPVVPSLDFLIGYAQLLTDAFHRQRDSFSLGLLRQLELFWIFVIKPLGSPLVQLDLIEIAIETEAVFLHFTLFALQSQHPVADGTRHHTGLPNSAGQLLQRQILAQLRLKAGRGHPLST